MTPNSVPDAYVRPDCPRCKGSGWQPFRIGTEWIKAPCQLCIEVAREQAGVDYREMLRRVVEDCTCEFRDCEIHHEARQMLYRSEFKDKVTVQAGADPAPCSSCGCEERDHRGILTCQCPERDRR